MTELITGGCLCGYVRYEYKGELEAANYCHCRDCRKTTGSAFNIGVRLQSAALHIVTGQVKSYTKNGDNIFFNTSLWAMPSGVSTTRMVDLVYTCGVNAEH